MADTPAPRTRKCPRHRRARLRPAQQPWAAWAEAELRLRLGPSPCAQPCDGTWLPREAPPPPESAAAAGPRPEGATEGPGQASERAEPWAEADPPEVAAGTVRVAPTPPADRAAGRPQRPTGAAPGSRAPLRSTWGGQSVTGRRQAEVRQPFAGPGETTRSYAS